MSLSPSVEARGNPSVDGRPRPGLGAKGAAPFSLRLTPEERARLEREAGDRPLGAYIRMRLLTEESAPRRQRRRRPVEDHAALAQVLAALGRSHLAGNLNQLARAVNSSSLPVTPDTEAALLRACADVAAMRAALLRALGLEAGS